MQYLTTIIRIATFISLIYMALYIHKYTTKKEGKQKRTPQKTMSFQNVNRIHIPLNPEQIKMIEASGLKSVQIGNKTYYEEGCDIEAEKQRAAGKQSVSD